MIRNMTPTIALHSRSRNGSLTDARGGATWVLSHHQPADHARDITAEVADRVADKCHQNAGRYQASSVVRGDNCRGSDTTNIGSARDCRRVKVGAEDSRSDD